MTKRIGLYFVLKVANWKLRNAARIMAINNENGTPILPSVPFLRMPACWSDAGMAMSPEEAKGDLLKCCIDALTGRGGSDYQNLLPLDISIAVDGEVKVTPNDAAVAYEQRGKVMVYTDLLNQATGKNLFQH